MKPKTNSIIRCINYFNWKGEYLALVELLAMCERRGWLKHAAGFMRVFQTHRIDIRLLWNILNHEELVMLISLLMDKGYIEIKGSNGFWAAVERHLCDFEGNPIHRSLSDLKCHIEKNPGAHEGKWNKVRKVVAKMEIKFPPKN